MLKDHDVFSPLNYHVLLPALGGTENLCVKPDYQILDLEEAISSVVLV